MRRVLVLAAATPWLLGAAEVPPIPTDLQAAVERYDRAQLDGNRAELERSLADDYLLVNSSGATETKAQLIADYTAPGFDLQTLTIADPVSRIWDGGAVMGGIGTLRGVDQGKPFDARLRFADVWAKRGGNWQVIYTHAEKAAPASASSNPTIRLSDPELLNSAITFGPPDPKLGAKVGGEIWWRADVDLPPKVKVGRVFMHGYAPVFLELSDGRCFKVDFPGRQPKMDEAIIGEASCEAAGPSDAPPSELSRPGLRYVGKSWDIDAWRDPATGKTSLFLTRDPKRPPLLTTGMRVVGFGGLGSPDTPMTEVTLVGYIGSQLTLVTMALYYP